jgi:hypothetical protein
MTKAVAFLTVLLLCGCGLLCGCDIDPPDRMFCEPGSTCPEEKREETCPGRCVSYPPIAWSRPVLLWSGPDLEAPACPAGLAERMVYEGHADPVDAPACPTCGCEPPTAECELPTVITVSTETCPEGAGGTLYDFSPPDLWDGTCTGTNTIPKALNPKSMTYGKVLKKESGCQPTESMAPLIGAATWKTLARACVQDEPALCLDRNALCVPTAEPPPGFTQCIYRTGEHQCPADYPDRRVFYADLFDSRRCSACSCGAPVDGDCLAWMTTFQEPGCSHLENSLLTGSAVALCIDVLHTDLVSKLGSTPYYLPGSCASFGGELLGSAEPLGPATFCCQ